jgi:hypothetical protein
MLGMEEIVARSVVMMVVRTPASLLDLVQSIVFPPTVGYEQPYEVGLQIHSIASLTGIGSL